MSTDAFTQLVDDHYASLYRFALSLARRTADAADLTQQTFYLWATKGNALRDKSKVKSWLFTTLYREFLRGRRKDSRLSSIEDLDTETGELVDQEIDALRKCDAATVMNALGEVDETYRAPLTLFYLEDLSYSEIAEALEVPTGTVMSRLSRGKLQLRQVLSQTQNQTKTVPFPNAQKRNAP